MTDFIKTSREIDAALKAQKITIEVDEFAPKVWHYKPHEPPPPDCGEGPADYYDVGSHPMTADLAPTCPFFGPGGADNCLKALRALEEKNIIYSFEINRILTPGFEPSFWCAAHRERDRDAGRYMGDGNSDGEALRDLLYKVVTK